MSTGRPSGIVTVTLVVSSLAFLACKKAPAPVDEGASSPTSEAALPATATATATVAATASPSPVQTAAARLPKGSAKPKSGASAAPVGSAPLTSAPIVVATPASVAPAQTQAPAPPAPAAADGAPKGCFVGSGAPLNAKGQALTYRCDGLSGNEYTCPAGYKKGPAQCLFTCTADSQCAAPYSKCRASAAAANTMTCRKPE